MESIKFENEFYLVRELVIPEFGYVKVSTLGLNFKMMLDDGSYFSEKARILDEDIFFYVELNQIMFNEYQLINLLKSEL